MIETLLAAAAATTPAGFGGPADIWAAIVKDFSNITQPSAFAAFVQVLMIDLVLAGDNAIVVGALAAGLPAEQRKKVIFIGVIAALVPAVDAALAAHDLGVRHHLCHHAEIVGFGGAQHRRGQIELARFRAFARMTVLELTQQ